LDIVLRRFGLVIEQAGADHELCVLGGAEPHRNAVEDGKIARGPEVKHGRVLVLAKLVAGEIARGDGDVICIIGHAEAAKLFLHSGSRTRRIGEEHYDAAPRAKVSRRRDRAGESAVPVMHHAPDIDEPGAIARTDLLDRGDERDGWSDQRHAARLEARSLRVKLAGQSHWSRYFGFAW